MFILVLVYYGIKSYLLAKGALGLGFVYKKSYNYLQINLS